MSPASSSRQSQAEHQHEELAITTWWCKLLLFQGPLAIKLLARRVGRRRSGCAPGERIPTSLCTLLRFRGRQCLVALRKRPDRNLSQVLVAKGGGGVWGGCPVCWPWALIVLRWPARSKRAEARILRWRSAGHASPVAKMLLTTQRVVHTGTIATFYAATVWEGELRW
jgi:hypothetical protein